MKQVDAAGVLDIAMSGNFSYLVCSKMGVCIVARRQLNVSALDEKSRWLMH